MGVLRESNSRPLATPGLLKRFIKVYLTSGTSCSVAIQSATCTASLELRWCTLPVLKEGFNVVL